ncbi:29385_t:CDS:1, partial [Racocetra persica]
MAAQELLKNESVNCSIQVEAESSNQISYDRCMEKSSKTTMPQLPDLSKLIDKLKNDREFHEVKDGKDEDLLHPDYLDYFCEIYNVTRVRPLFVDHSGFMLLVLDNCGF